MMNILVRKFEVGSVGGGQDRILLASAVFPLHYIRSYGVIYNYPLLALLPPLRCIHRVRTYFNTMTSSSRSSNPHPRVHSPPAIPLNSPLRTHPKRGLPPILSSTYPHGHISGLPRSPSQERAFQSRKAEILRTMTASQIEAKYQETVAEIRKVMEESKKEMEKWEREHQKLKDQRELERRFYTLKQKEGSEG